MRLTCAFCLLRHAVGQTHYRLRSDKYFAVYEQNNVFYTDSCRKRILFRKLSKGGILLILIITMGLFIIRPISKFAIYFLRSLYYSYTILINTTKKRGTTYGKTICLEFQDWPSGLSKRCKRLARRCKLCRRLVYLLVF